jgi:hypothetical protein
MKRFKFFQIPGVSFVNPGINWLSDNQVTLSDQIYDYGSEPVVTDEVNTATSIALATNNIFAITDADEDLGPLFGISIRPREQAEEETVAFKQDQAATDRAKAKIQQKLVRASLQDTTLQSLPSLPHAKESLSEAEKDMIVCWKPGPFWQIEINKTAPIQSFMIFLNYLFGVNIAIDPQAQTKTPLRTIMLRAQQDAERYSSVELDIIKRFANFLGNNPQLNWTIDKLFNELQLPSCIDLTGLEASIQPPRVHSTTAASQAKPKARRVMVKPPNTSTAPTQWVIESPNIDTDTNPDIKVTIKIQPSTFNAAEYNIRIQWVNANSSAPHFHNFNIPKTEGFQTVRYHLERHRNQITDNDMLKGVFSEILHTPAAKDFLTKTIDSTQSAAEPNAQASHTTSSAPPRPAGR